ncbi:MAG: DUF2339 domain-containing protein [bacterium]|nr:DUF2339 domain-containing protein [bacterium]
MEFFLIIAIVVLFFLVSNLKTRVGQLESRLREGERAISPVPPVQSVPQAQSQASAPSVSAPAGVQAVDWSARFIEWAKEDWIMKLGTLLLLIGFGWFVSYAFLNNWIGPMGRIMLGLVAGALIMALGWWRIQKFLNQGGVFLVLGSTVILLTTFAARELYDFFTPAIALVLMFLSTVFVAYVSVIYKSRALSFASLVLAGLAPALTNSPATDYIGLFSYLLIVVIGAVWIVALTGERELAPAALILVSFYSLPHLFYTTDADKGALLLFAYAFSAVFFLTNTASIIRGQIKDITPNLVTAGGTGIFLLAWIMSAAPEVWQSLIIASWMVVFSAGAFLIYRITGRREPFYAYALVAVAYLAAATSAELEGATLAIAYTIESGLIAFVTYYFLADLGIALRMSLLLAGPMLLSLRSIILYSEKIVFNEDFFVLLFVSAITLGLGYFFYLRAKESNTGKDQVKYSVVLMIVGSAFAYTLLWLALHTAFAPDYDSATMLSLVVYTLVGLAAYFYALAHDGHTLKYYGGAMLGFVVGRLILVDVWDMELSGRIITFFAIGALLISTAFYGRRNKSVAPPPEPANTINNNDDFKI